jgi:hypothetical protein
VQVLADLDLSINKANISSDGLSFMDIFHVTEVFAVLADMECSVMEDRAWTHRGCFACVAFLCGEDAAADRVARILSSSSATSSAVTPWRRRGRCPLRASRTPPLPPPAHGPGAGAAASEGWWLGKRRTAGIYGRIEEEDK